MSAIKKNAVAFFGVALFVALSIAISMTMHSYFFNSKEDQTVDSAISLEGGHFSLPEEFKPYVGTLVERNYPAIIVTIFTILGVFSKAILDYANRKERPLWKMVAPPLLISPIIINPTFSMLAAHPDGFVASLIAFQNGFFWQTLTETLRK
ncbi:MAG: hypothetical protein AAFY29_22040 [Pseudomonadota bacterium]